MVYGKLEKKKNSQMPHLAYFSFAVFCKNVPKISSKDVS